MSGRTIKKVAVLMGGISSEREISFSTGKGVALAIKELGYCVKTIDVTQDLGKLIRNLMAFHPDIVFNALHGRFGEDGTIQGILNWLHIPYTHSGMLASCMGMDKDMTRKIAHQIQIPIAMGGLKSCTQFQKMALPLVVKPNNEGSSCGVMLVLNETQRRRVVKTWPVGQKLLVEKYIPGRELSVAVLDGRALGVVELRVKKGWYDYKNKYQSGAVQHLIPAPLPKKITKKLCHYAEKIHQSLGCRGVTRSDFRLDDTGRVMKPYFLEINTNPGMTPTSLVPDLAGHCGITYAQLVQILIQEAQCD